MPQNIEALDFTEFAQRYCGRQVSTPEQLLATLKSQAQRYNPTGWMLLQCQDMCSSRMGEFVVLAYGPNNTFQTLPDRPISPRGLASDMSVVVATLSLEELQKA